MGGALPALLALTVSPAKALAVVALFVLVNQVEGNFLQPKVMGRRVRVPSALVLVSILLMATLIGTLVAIPAAVVVVTLTDQLTAEESSRQKEKAEEPAGEQARDRVQ